MKLMSWMFIALFSISTYAQNTRNVAQYNLDSAGVSVTDVRSGEAFDPVAYFPEGGGIAVKGLSSLSLDYEGVTYYFSTEANRELFKTNPAKYEPTYGSWCARAMVVGQKVQINTQYFTVVGNRLYLFVNRRAKRFFDRNVSRYANEADQNWKRISGEEPRL